MCGNVKGKISTETSDNLTITSPFNGTALRQQTRQSRHASKAARMVPGFSNNSGSFDSHWYKFGALRVKSGNSPACAGYVINNSVRDLPANQAGKTEAIYIAGVMRKE
jgi:hypothetical protein